MGVSAEYRCCHGAEDGPHSPTCPYDKKFWGPGGAHPQEWGSVCQRGLVYRDLGVTTDGAKNQRRTFGGGRKHRGMASA